MNSLILMSALLCGATNNDIVSGTLVFLDHSHPVVESWTDNPCTHVAIILIENGSPYVYEAEPPKVRRVPLSDYLKTLSTKKQMGGRKSLKIWLARPKIQYTSKEISKIKTYLHTQLGRKYAVCGYVTGKPGKGVHCAEVVGHALSQTSRFKFKSPHQMSPGNLREEVKISYSREAQIAIQGKKSKLPVCQYYWRVVVSTIKNPPW